MKERRAKVIIIAGRHYEGKRNDSNKKSTTGMVSTCRLTVFNYKCVDDCSLAITFNQYV